MAALCTANGHIHESLVDARRCDAEYHEYITLRRYERLRRSRDEGGRGLALWRAASLTFLVGVEVLALVIAVGAREIQKHLDSGGA